MNECNKPRDYPLNKPLLRFYCGQYTPLIYTGIKKSVAELEGRASSNVACSQCAENPLASGFPVKLYQ